MYGTRSHSNLMLKKPEESNAQAGVLSRSEQKFDANIYQHANKILNDKNRKKPRIDSPQNGGLEN